ncbi:ribose-phosphate diphosphokinase [Clostridium paraputrificum]|uniref:ribose-phosphate diphosphokinase n=1 Tax=Clostridium TaxID=1485 RepID=UPI003D335F9E
MIFLNGERVEIKEFPNGESLISSESLNIFNDINEIKVKFESDKDITHLIFIKGYLEELNLKCNLVIPYMPYSRMDRTEGMTVFTLKYLCKLINNMDFENVTVYEPHSEVTIALLDRVKTVNMSKKLTEKLLKEIKDESVYIVYPDAGAAKRYGKQINYKKVLTANKERDFKTGYIKKLDINGEVEGEFTAVIVDDLCSRGGTFVLTAEKLKEIGAKNIYLIVTHCEDTIFEGDILKTNLINKVYTTNSILSKEHEKIVIKSI